MKTLSGPLLRKALPSPSAITMGNTSVQNIASGSRRNSLMRHSVSCASWFFRKSLIAQLPACECDEHVLERRVMCGQSGEGCTAPLYEVEQCRHGCMHLLHGERSACRRSAHC